MASLRHNTWHKKHTDVDVFLAILKVKAYPKVSVHGAAEEACNAWANSPRRSEEVKTGSEGVTSCLFPIEHV